MSGIETEIEALWQASEQVADCLVVGVSGGADSLALVFLLQEWAEKNQKKVVALTVDHGLRPSSAEEARYVSGLMKVAGIEHHVLVWSGDKPTKGIEAAAREARYWLIERWWQERLPGKEVYPLWVAHHLRDQAETVLMRLQRGSGADGLGGMAPISKVGCLQLLRPLLKTDPRWLRRYLQERNIAWAEDESNACDDYLRVRVRKLLPVLEEKMGLSMRRLGETAELLRRTRAYLDEQTEAFLAQNSRCFGNAGLEVDFAAWQQEHEEMQLRVLREALKRVAGQVYRPERLETERLRKSLLEDAGGRTLAGCEIFKFQKKLWLVRESRNVPKLSKAAWKAYVEAHPQYCRLQLPYKLRRILVLE